VNFVKARFWQNLSRCAWVNPSLGFNWKSGQRAPKRFSQGSGLTEYVGRFVVSTKYEDIPGDVIELGKKSILDGLGLALAGSRAKPERFVVIT